MSTEFKDGGKKLIPVVWSHGLVANSNYYNILAMEFASNGYVVFALDHLDGSAGYIELKNDMKKFFDLNQYHPDDF